MKNDKEEPKADVKVEKPAETKPEPKAEDRIAKLEKRLDRLEALNRANGWTD